MIMVDEIKNNSSWDWHLFQDRLTLCLSYERQLTEEKFRATEQGLHLQAIEYERRLEILDKANDQWEAAQKLLLDSDIFEHYRKTQGTEIKEIRERLQDLENASSNAKALMVRWIAVIGLVITASAWLIKIIFDQ